MSNGFFYCYFCRTCFTMNYKQNPFDEKFLDVPYYFNLQFCIFAKNNARSSY